MCLLHDLISFFFLVIRPISSVDFQHNTAGGHAGPDKEVQSLYVKVLLCKGPNYNVLVVAEGVL